jgi:hypothetical protein
MVAVPDKAERLQLWQETTRIDAALVGFFDDCLECCWWQARQSVATNPIARMHIMNRRTVTIFGARRKGAGAMGHWLSQFSSEIPPVLGHIKHRFGVMYHTMPYDSEC